MKKQVENRMYNVSDADLYIQCMEAIRAAHRDGALFQQYGYSTERLKTFQALCEQFQTVPGDDELVGDQMIGTEKKNLAAEKLKTAIRSVMTRVALKFHDKTGRYRKFGTAKLGDMSDSQLLFCGRRVVRVARQQLDFLADTGLNENVLKRVMDAASEFENAMNIQQDKWHDRDIAVERRTDQGNENIVTNNGFELFLKEQIEQYYTWQQKAKKGWKYLPYRSRIAVITASDGYNWTAKKIYNNPAIVFNKKVKPSKAILLLFACKNFIKAVFY
jgi:hypothetical protein